MDPSSDRSQLGRNALVSYAERVLLILSALLLTPYLFRQLDPAGFGTWSVMFTITTVFSMLELGFSAGTTKLVAEHRARGEREALDRTVGIAVVLMGGLGLAALAVSAAVAFLAPGLAADGLRDDFQAGMLVLGAAMLVRFPCVAYGATLAGYQRYDLFNGSLAFTTVAFVAGAIVAVETGGGVFGVAVAWAAALVLGGLAFAVMLMRTDPAASLRARPGAREERRRILGFSTFALLADSAAFIGQRMDTVVVAAIRSASAAAPIAAAAKLQSGLQALTLPVLNMLMPMASDLEARGRSDAVAHRLSLATRATLQVTLPLAVAVALFATDIVDVWLGDEAPGVTDEIVAVLAIQTLFICATPPEKVLVGIGRVRLVSALNTAEGLTNLTLSIVLVSSYGAIGAALGSLIASALLGPLKFPAACRVIGRGTFEFLRESVGRAILSSLPALAAMGAIYALLDPGLGRLAAGFAAAVVLAGAVAARQLPTWRLQA